MNFARPAVRYDAASVVNLLAEADLYMRDSIIAGNLDRIGEWFLDAAYQTIERHQLQGEWFRMTRRRSPAGRAKPGECRDEATHETSPAAAGTPGAMQ
jgi:hypothetical protein